MSDKKFKDVENNISSLIPYFSIVVAGATNSGKSSLLNLLIGEKILPVNYKSETTKPLRIIHVKDAATELWVDQQRITKDISGNLKKINNYIKKNNKNSRFYESQLILKTNIKQLSANNMDLDALCLYDTPGSSERDFFENKQNNETLKNASAIIFLISIF